MIAEQIDRLCEVLSALESRHRQLYQMAEEKQEALIAVEIDDLMEVVEREEELLEDINDLEARRQSLSDKLTGSIEEIEPGQFNLSALIEYLENESILSDLREKLAAQQDSLQNLLQDLERLNEQNRELLLEAMKFNEFSLKVLLQGATPNSTYQPDGSGREDNGGQSSSIIDRRA